MTTPADEGAAAARRDTHGASEATALLWWSSRGRIACTAHVPQPGSDAWWSDRWELADEAWIAGFTGSRGTPPHCEACVALERLAQLMEGAS